MKPTGHFKIQPYHLWLLALVTGIAIFSRLFLGIDFTDEAYFVAMSDRFFHGAQPFVDELFVHQTTALLLTPLIRTHHLFFNEHDFIVLWFRLFYFLFVVLMASNLFLILTRLTHQTAALVVTLLYLSFVPFNIFNFTYNTLGLSFFTLGLWLGCVSVLCGSIAVTLLSGLSLGFSFFVYPSFVLTVPILIGSYYYARAKFSSRLLSVLLIAMLVPLLILLPILLKAGFAALNDSLHYSLTSFGHAGGLKKFQALAGELVRYPSRRLSLTFSVVALTLFFRKSHARLSFLLLLTLPLTVLYAVVQGGLIFATWYVFYFSSLGLFFFFLCEHSRIERLLLLNIYVPSMVAGGISAWSSVNGIGNFAIGAFPAAMVSSYFLMNAIKRLAVQANALSYLSTDVLPIIATIFAPFILLISLFSFTYRDGSVFALPRTVESGPYKGLRTSNESYEFLTRISSDISRLTNNVGRIVFYDFPAGHLLTTMPSGVPTTFMRHASNRKDCYLKYYRRHFGPSNYVFEVIDMPHHYSLSGRTRAQSRLVKLTFDAHSEDAWHRYIWQTHRLVAHRKGYLVYSTTE